MVEHGPVSKKIHDLGMQTISCNKKAKIEESENAGSRQESNPGHLTCVASALPLSNIESQSDHEFFFTKIYFNANLKKFTKIFETKLWSYSSSFRLVKIHPRTRAIFYRIV